MGKYDFDDGGSGSSGEQRDTLKMEPPAMIRGEVDSLFTTSHDQYGQSLAISINNVSLVDGILGYPLKDENGNQDKNGEPDTTSPKVLSWEAEPSLILDEDSTVDDLNERVQRNYVGTNYYYGVETARLEEDKDVGYENDPEEEIELGDFVMFFGATDNGPKSASKTLSKILSAQGSDVVVDEDALHSWLDEDIALRDDLMGREIILALTLRESDETGRNFHHPFVLDGSTRTPIFADNSATQDEEQDEEVEDEEVEDENDGPDVPDDIQSLYDTCNELNIHQEDAVEGLMDDMLDDGDISEESVEEVGRDNIIDHLTE